MSELKLRGGARIGMANATWPLATLKVNKNSLELNSVIGRVVFQASDMVSIEAYETIPIIGQGIKLNHSVPSYEERVIFWTFRNPDEIIKQIEATGFLANLGTAERTIHRSIKAKQARGGFPLKKGVAIGTVVIWSLLLLADFIPSFLEKIMGLPRGSGGLAASGFLLLAAIVSLISVDFRRLILKDGTDLTDVKKFAIFAVVMGVFILLKLDVMAIANHWRVTPP